MKRILSLDGGGIRGVFSARILEHIERAIGAPCAQVFDLIGGVSTGGILAAGLVHTTDHIRPTYRAADFVRLYLDNGKKIFSRAWWKPAALLRCKYEADGIESVLAQYYGTVPLSSALTETLITAYDIVANKPKFFKRCKAQAIGTADDVTLAYAARASAAAPTYFPPKDQYVDGGVFATDPAMCCYAEACATWPSEPVFLLSIGTGTSTKPIDPKIASGWGGLGWLQPIIDLLFDANALNVQFEVNQFIASDKYIRVQVPLEGEVPDHRMDNASPENIRALIKLADRYILDHPAQLSQIAAACK